MKLKLVFALAASLSLVAGNALAADNSHSQRYQKNSSQSMSQSQQKVKKNASDHFARIVDMKYDQKQRNNMHPIHQTHMGDR